MYKVVYNKETNDITGVIDIKHFNPSIFGISENEGELLLGDVPKDIENYLANEEGLYAKPPQPHVPTDAERISDLEMALAEVLGGGQ